MSGDSDSDSDMVGEDGGVVDAFALRAGQNSNAKKKSGKQQQSFYASSSDDSDSSDGSGSSDDSDDDSDDNYGMRAPAPVEDEGSDHEDLFGSGDAASGSRSSRRASLNEDVTSGWGKKARAFYGQDDIDSDDETDGLRGAALAAARKKKMSKDPELRQHKLQEREALRLQKISKEGMTAADFELGSSDSDSDSDSDSEANGKASRRRSNSGKKKGTKSGAEPSDENEKAEEEIISRDHSSLTTEEKLSIVVKDSPELLGILEELKSKASELQKKVQPILNKVRPPGTSNAGEGDDGDDQKPLPPHLGWCFVPRGEAPPAPQLHHQRWILPRPQSRWQASPGPSRHQPPG